MANVRFEAAYDRLAEETTDLLYKGHSVEQIRQLRELTSGDPEVMLGHLISDPALLLAFHQFAKLGLWEAVRRASAKYVSESLLHEEPDVQS